MAKVIVVGLDGATWDLLKPWADRGELGSLKNLMESGVWGTLESIIPPLSGPAWASFLTGKNPGKHGVFGFGKLEDNSVRLYRSDDVRAKTLFSLLSEGNVRCVVIGLPLSFPPSGGFSGIMVSDFLYPSKAILPRSKRKYMEDYRVVPDFSLEGDELLGNMIETAKRQVEVAKRLFVEEDWDFYTFYLGLTDTILHYYWKEVCNNTALGQRAKEIYRVADEFLGWVSNRIGAGTILFVISDHGFTSCPYKVNLNSLFMKRQLLRTRVEDAAKREDETLWGHVKGLAMKERGKKRRRRAVQRPPLRNIPLKLAVYRVVKFVLQRVTQPLRHEKASPPIAIDYNNSTAFVLPGCVSVHIRETDEKEREETTQEIIGLLKRLKHKGQRVFDQVLPKDEVYSGAFAESSPDILLVPNRFFVASDLGAEVYTEYNQGASHDERGLFLAHGHGIRTSAAKLASFRIYDIVPTVLHIFGLPVPEDLDGRVLREIFEEGSEPAQSETAYQGAEDAKERLRKRIRRLNLTS